MSMRVIIKEKKCPKNPKYWDNRRGALHDHRGKENWPCFLLKGGAELKDADWDKFNEWLEKKYLSEIMVYKVKDGYMVKSLPIRANELMLLRLTWR